MFEAKDLGIEDMKSVPENVELEHKDQEKLQRIESLLADGKHLSHSGPQGLVIEHIVKNLPIEKFKRF